MPAIMFWGALVLLLWCWAVATMQTACSTMLMVVVVVLSVLQGPLIVECLEMQVYFWLNAQTLRKNGWKHRQNGFHRATHEETFYEFCVK